VSKLGHFLFRFCFIFIYLFCHSTNIIKTVKEKVERIDPAMARRPKGNYEAYIK